MNILRYFILMLWHYIIVTVLVILAISYALKPLVKKRLYRVGIGYFVSVILRLAISGSLLGFHHYLLPSIRPTFVDIFSVAIAFITLKKLEDPPLY